MSVIFRCGAFHSIAVTDNGNLYTCGFGKHGQVPCNACARVRKPIKVFYANLSIHMLTHVYAHIYTTNVAGMLITMGGNSCESMPCHNLHACVDSHRAPSHITRSMHSAAQVALTCKRVENV